MLCLLLFILHADVPLYPQIHSLGWREWCAPAVSAVVTCPPHCWKRRCFSAYHGCNKWLLPGSLCQSCHSHLTSLTTHWMFFPHTDLYQIKHRYLKIPEDLKKNSKLIWKKWLIFDVNIKLMLLIYYILFYSIAVRYILPEVDFMNKLYLLTKEPLGCCHMIDMTDWVIAWTSRRTCIPNKMASESIFLGLTPSLSEKD